MTKYFRKDPQKHEYIFCSPIDQLYGIIEDTNQPYIFHSHLTNSKRKRNQIDALKSEQENTIRRIRYLFSLL